MENPSTPLEERLKISKTVNFESDLLKTNEDIAFERREILQTALVWWGAHTQTSVNFRNFAKLYLRLRNTYRFQIWRFYRF